MSERWGWRLLRNSATLPHLISAFENVSVDSDILTYFTFRGRDAFGSCRAWLGIIVGAIPTHSLTMIKVIETKTEMLTLLEDSEHIDTDGGKHDCTLERHVFKIEGDHYACWLEFSYNNGLEDGPYRLQKVKPISVRKIEWVEDKD